MAPTVSILSSKMSPCNPFVRALPAGLQHPRQVKLAECRESPSSRSDGTAVRPVDPENHTMSLRRLITLAMLLDMTLHAVSRAADSKQLDPKQAYAKKATWAETMVTTRANCAQWAKGVKEGQLVGTPLPAVWAKIQADWPEQGRVVSTRSARQPLPRLVPSDQHRLRTLDHEPSFGENRRGRRRPEPGTRGSGPPQGLGQRSAMAGTICTGPAFRGRPCCKPSCLAERSALSVRAASRRDAPRENALGRRAMGHPETLGQPLRRIQQGRSCGGRCGVANRRRGAGHGLARQIFH